MAASVASIVILPASPTSSCNRSSISGSSKHSHLLPNRWHTRAHRLLSGSKKSHRGGHGREQSCGVARAYENRKSNPIDDPFNWGDDPDLEDGFVMNEGKQSADVPRPPKSRIDKDSLAFPPFHVLEMSNLGIYIRGDVRRCLCWVQGGVYENLLFFPAIELIRNRYPGVKIDVVAGERGKQTYEMNKYINKAIVFDTDAQWTVPGDYLEFLGELRGEYYDMILSTKYAGFKHATTLFMVGGRTRRISYVPTDHSEWVSNRFLTEAIVAKGETLADEGYNMYEEMLDYVAQPGKGVPQEPIPVLQIGVSKRVKKVVQEKEHEAGLTERKFIVFHGIESDSEASMTSPGDKDCLLPLRFWGQLRAQLEESSGLKVVVVVPHKKERVKVFQECGEEVSVIFITTPGQLASLIKDSAGVVSTNTAAMLMAIALKKPSVALFCSAQKASLFVPSYAEKAKVVWSKTGKLADVDLVEAASAWKNAFGGQLVLAA